jgi:glycosyltransferase involved in cell wall biosynthesis
VENTLACAAGGELAASAPAADVVPLPMRGDLDVRLVSRLRRVLADRKPDLVHVHSRRGAELFGAAAASLAQVPAVITRRVDSAEPKFWARFKYRRYRAVVAISRAVQAQLEQCAGLEPARIHHIASAVDGTLFRPDDGARRRVLEEFGLPDDAVVVGVVAQLIRRKGHRTLLLELPALIDRHPRLRVLCFGRGPLEPMLQSAITALGLGEQVRLAGWRRDLPRLLPGLDVLVHPAEREGLGIAVLEALACGVPVIACAAGGVVDVFEHDVHGLMVPVADGAALRRALERLLEAPDVRAAYGAAGREHVLRSFSVERLVARHVQLYGAL